MVTDLQPQLAAFFEADAHGAIAVYLFGSVARGDATAASDVDVAVLFDQAPEPALDGAVLTLEGEIERHLGRPVDLVSLNGAPADLVDLEPVRRQYRRGARPASTAAS